MNTLTTILIAGALLNGCAMAPASQPAPSAWLDRVEVRSAAPAYGLQAEIDTACTAVGNLCKEIASARARGLSRATVERVFQVLPNDSAYLRGVVGKVIDLTYTTDWPASNPAQFGAVNRLICIEAWGGRL